MKVAVYWNLHKDCFSVQSRERANYGLVVQHADEIVLQNVLPTVRERGRQRVLAEGRKNVHAFLVGEIVQEVGPTRGRPKRLRYNPHEMAAFQTETGEGVIYADYVVCSNVAGHPVIIGHGTHTDLDLDNYVNQNLH